MAVPDPFSFPQSWDIILINGMPWGGPAGMGGKISVEGATRFYKVDQKDGQGLDGATQTFRGVKPKPFRLRFSWWNTAQHVYWSLFSYQFIFTGSKQLGPPPVFGVTHPALQLLFISSILVDEVGQVMIDEHTKIASAIVVVRQFYPPPPIAATTTPVSAPPSPPATPTGLPAPTAEQALLQAQLYTTRAVAAGGVPASLPH